MDLVGNAEILGARIEQMLAFASQNDAKFKRFQMLEMRLLGIRSLDKLLSTIVDDCLTSCYLDAVSLILVDREYEIRRLAPNVESATEAKVMIVESTSILNQAVAGAAVALLSYEASNHKVLFAVEDAPNLGSIAIMPLYENEALLGALVFGSNRPDRYAGSLETDFLAHLGAVVSLCIQNTLNHARVKQLGLMDPLTQIHNRRYFDERLQEEVARVGRMSTPLSCLYLDIDHFKSINDTHGHAAGDEVLANVASAMHQELRPVDVLARYGGEEFVALLVNTSYEQAKVVAERVRATIESAIIALSTSTAHALQVQVTLSIGVASLDGSSGETNGFSGSDLVNLADQSLYVAKQSGRNCVKGWAELVRVKKDCMAD